MQCALILKYNYLYFLINSIDKIKKCDIIKSITVMITIFIIKLGGQDYGTE